MNLHELMSKNWRALGDAGAFMHEVMGSRFDFSDIVYTPPTEIFEGEKVLHVDSITRAWAVGDTRHHNVDGLARH